MIIMKRYNPAVNKALQQAAIEKKLKESTFDGIKYGPYGKYQEQNNSRRQIQPCFPLLFIVYHYFTSK